MVGACLNISCLEHCRTSPFLVRQSIFASVPHHIIISVTLLNPTKKKVQVTSIISLQSFHFCTAHASDVRLAPSFPPSYSFRHVSNLGASILAVNPGQQSTGAPDYCHRARGIWRASSLCKSPRILSPSPDVLRVESLQLTCWTCVQSPREASWLTLSNFFIRAFIKLPPLSHRPRV